MIPYELLPHEYSYALYLSYGFDLCPYDPMIVNMVSERYPRDEDETSDCDSDSNSDSNSEIDEDFSDSEIDEDFSDGVPQWLFFEPQEEDATLLQQNSSMNGDSKIIFGRFGQDSDIVAIPANPLIIEPEFDGFTIKIGEIECSFVTANRFGNIHSRTFRRSNNDDSCVSLQQQIPEIDEKEGTKKLQEAIKNDFSATAHFSVSETNKKSKVITKEDQPEHHQDPPPSQVISHFAIPSFDPVFNSPFSINFFCKSGSEISCVALSMRHMTLDLENHHSPAPSWFSTGKTVVTTMFTVIYSVSTFRVDFTFPPSERIHQSYFKKLRSAIVEFVLAPELKNRITVECLSGSFELDSVFITFDPGGSSTNTAVAVASHNWFIDHPSVWIAVFDPGGHRRLPPSVSSNLFTHCVDCFGSLLSTLCSSLKCEHSRSLLRSVLR